MIALRCSVTMKILTLIIGAWSQRHLLATIVLPEIRSSGGEIHHATLFNSSVIFIKGANGNHVSLVFLFMGYYLSLQAAKLRQQEDAVLYTSTLSP